MKNCVLPSRVSGRLKAPASKSMMQRALAAALLAHGKSELLDPGYCADTLAAMDIAKCLGAKIHAGESTVVVQGGFKPAASMIHCGESGLSLRLFTAIAAIHDREIELSGSGTLLRRPTAMVEKPLTALGVRVRTRLGFPPIRVCGPLAGGEADLDGSPGSQFLSGLLMALPLAQADTRIHVSDLKSIPYIDMTLQVLADFGIGIENDHYRDFFVRAGQTYTAQSLPIEGDWSAAAFLLVAGAIAGKVTVSGLRVDSTQADRRVLQALDQAGAEVRPHGLEVTVGRSSLRAFHFDATHAPDLFPPLVALACHCPGRSRIEGVQRLYFKESNRAQALQSEFSALGARITISGNTMKIDGAPLCGGIVSSHHDHRMAMALAVAALAAQGPVVIEASECVSKSYPGFFTELAAIGGQCHE